MDMPGEFSIYQKKVAIEKIRDNKYVAYIFDIKVLPGEDEEWISLDKKYGKRIPVSTPFRFGVFEVLI